jgi:hypothetical protein
LIFKSNFFKGPTSFSKGEQRNSEYFKIGKNGSLRKYLLSRFFANSKKGPVKSKRVKSFINIPLSNEPTRAYSIMTTYLKKQLAHSN